jgi:hypothetical protein
MSWGAWENNRKEIQEVGLQWEAQASTTISAATAYPLGQSKQKLSERLVQYIFSTMMDRLSLRMPDRRTKRLFAHMVLD